MTLPKAQLQALTIHRLRDLLDPGRVYYRPVVFDTLKRGDIVELQALAKGIQDLKAEYGDFDGLMKATDVAIRKAQAS